MWSLQYLFITNDYRLFIPHAWKPRSSLKKLFVLLNLYKFVWNKFPVWNKVQNSCLISLLGFEGYHLLEYYITHGQILFFCTQMTQIKTQIIVDFFLLYTDRYAIINLRKSLKSASSACKKPDRVWYIILLCETLWLLRGTLCNNK